MDYPDDCATGHRRLTVLDARLMTGIVPVSVSDADRAWLHDLESNEAAIGLDAASVAPDMLAALSNAGLPIAPGGAWTWGRDVVLDPLATLPLLRDDVLVVPPAAVLVALTSLPLKPLRQWVAARTGVRLKIGAGVHLRLWATQAVLISTAPIPLGGFLSGPQAGTRASIYLGVGGTQHVPL